MQRNEWQFSLSFIYMQILCWLENIPFNQVIDVLNYIRTYSVYNYHYCWIDLGVGFQWDFTEIHIDVNDVVLWKWQSPKHILGAKYLIQETENGHQYITGFGFTSGAEGTTTGNECSNTQFNSRSNLCCGVSITSNGNLFYLIQGHL